MPYIADRARDLASLSGTGAVTLAGTPPVGYQSFATALGSGSQVVRYCIQTQNNAAPGEWEVGKGTFNGTTGLTRDVVQSSSNAGALVNFTAGTKDVFITAPAELLNNANNGMQYARSRCFDLP
jgi:hypothetical protein